MTKLPSMKSSTQGKPSCSSDAAACNTAAPVIPTVADPEPLHWPRFLIAKSRDDMCITKHNAFVISKAIQGITGTSTVVKRLVKAGLLLIEVDCRNYANNLLKTTMFHNIPVEITEHRTLNSSKGVISSDILDGMSNEEITSELKDQGVKESYRISSNKNGKKSPTRTVILTFNSSKLPKTLLVGYMRLSVRNYIPNPRRCFKCQQFGHTTKFCQNDAVCAQCGQSGHEDKDCKNSPKCINCEGAHSSSSRDCSQWKFQKEILTYKVENDVPYPEAVKKVNDKYMQSKSSYATVTSLSSSQTASTSTATISKFTISKADMSVQTEYTWPQSFERPVLLSECTVILEDKSNDKDNEEMECENNSSKRGRCSSVGDLPDIEAVKSKVAKRYRYELKHSAHSGNQSGGTLGERNGGRRQPASLSQGDTGRKAVPASAPQCRSSLPLAASKAVEGAGIGAGGEGGGAPSAQVPLKKNKEGESSWQTKSRGRSGTKTPCSDRESSRQTTDYEMQAPL